MRENAIADSVSPMMEKHDQADPALTWWNEQISAHRDWWRDRVGRTFKIDGGVCQRWDDDIARAAYHDHLAGFYPPG